MGSNQLGERIRSRADTGSMGQLRPWPEQAPPRLAALPPLASPAAAVEGYGLSNGHAVAAGSLSLAVGLFAAVWVCFAALVAVLPRQPLTSDLDRLGQLLTVGVAVLAVVLGTLSVAHLQVTNLRPRLAAVAVLAAGVVQGRWALALASGGSGLWGPAGHIFELVGCAVPLTWVAAEFQQGVRRQRAERRDSVLTAYVARARYEGRRTTEAAHRHEVRSMLFVVDGAARALAGSSGTLGPADREMFGRMVDEGIGRLTGLMEIRPDEIAPFAADAVARSVVHAERKAGRTIAAALPAGLNALGRSADVITVLHTLCGSLSASASGHDPAVRITGEAQDGAVVLYVETADADASPLSVENWRYIQVESLCSGAEAGEQDKSALYVAARLLADQGADLWATSGAVRRFAVRLPADPRVPEVSA